MSPHLEYIGRTEFRRLQYLLGLTDANKREKLDSDDN